MSFVTRFAPSPTGPLHLGHAYSACLAHDMARASNGEFLLRIDDIDQSRARPHWEAQLIDDLTWLGLRWDRPIWRQSEHFPHYQSQLDQLSDRGLLYPCCCKRADIKAAASAPQEGVPQFGPDGLIYPGTCRNRPLSERQPADALRLNLSKALDQISTPLRFTETGPLHSGTHEIAPDDLLRTVGDPVLARPHMAASYHFSVILDDAAQNVTHVIRGADLFEATALQVALQALLGLPTPCYHHHDLIRDAQGKRLAKRDDARALSTYRDQGLSPHDIRAKFTP